MEPGTQRRQCNDEFCCVAERRIQETSDSFAQAFRQLFRSSSEPPGEWQDGKA